MDLALEVELSPAHERLWPPKYQSVTVKVAAAGGPGLSSVGDRDGLRGFDGQPRRRDGERRKKEKVLVLVHDKHGLPQPGEPGPAAAAALKRSRSGLRTLAATRRPTARP